MDLTNSKYGMNVISVAQAGINNSWKIAFKTNKRFMISLISKVSIMS